MEPMCHSVYVLIEIKTNIPNEIYDLRVLIMVLTQRVLVIE